MFYYASSYESKPSRKRELFAWDVTGVVQYTSQRSCLSMAPFHVCKSRRQFAPCRETPNLSPYSVGRSERSSEPSQKVVSVSRKNDAVLCLQPFSTIFGKGVCDFRKLSYALFAEASNYLLQTKQIGISLVFVLEIVCRAHLY